MCVCVCVCVCVCARVRVCVYIYIYSSLNKFHITKPNRRKFNVCNLFKFHNSWVTGDHFDFTHPAARNLTALLCEGVCTQTSMIRYSTHVRTNT